MPRQLTYPEALWRLLRGQYVPHSVYETLRRSGMFRFHRHRRIPTNQGRALLRKGGRVAA